MQLNQADILTLIEPHFHEYITESSYSIHTLPAIDFLTHSRFDLAFKLLYLDLLDKKVNFASEAYKQHIRAFSLGKYTEPGNENKNSIEAFYNEFEKTYNNIKAHGFDKSKTLIPLSENNNILNGAHRVASAIKLNKQVDCVRLPISDLFYDYKFFYERNVPTEMLDAAALKFIEYANNIYIACIWPTAQGHDDEIEQVIPNIVYRKNISLSYNGAHNLISQIYTGEHWLGSVNNDFRGSKGKLVECFKQQGPVRIVAFQAESLDKVLQIKEDIRQLFNVGKHSIHITDTKEEAVNTAQLVLNDNSIHFLNHAKPNTFQDFHTNLDNVKDFLASNNINSENLILDGDMILSAYGLRKANDIDFFISNKSNITIHTDGFEPHDNVLKYHKKSNEDLIYNPTNYFYFQGLKFISLPQIFLMKSNRKSKQDLKDCKLIKDLVDKNQIQKYIIKAKQNIGYQKIIVKTKAIKLLKSSGLYHPVRAVYKRIKGRK